MSALDTARARVLDHPLYARLTTIEALRTFTEHHVWAVWDFMVLLCALHRALVHRDDPLWSPPDDPEAVRLVNEIMVVEETDRVAGRVWSHFELYVAAMREMGADTSAVDLFSADRARWPHGDPLRVAAQAGAPPGAVAFLASTLAFGRALPVQIAAVFTFGREALIPEMFEHVLAVPIWPAHATGLFREYIERHVEVDVEHGRMARDLVDGLIIATPDGARLAEAAGATALGARAALWDATLAAIEEG